MLRSNFVFAGLLALPLCLAACGENKVDTDVPNTDNDNDAGADAAADTSEEASIEAGAEAAAEAAADGEADADASAPTGGPGAACWTDDDCEGDAVCWTADEEGFPGGYCVIEGCDANSCPDGSGCFEFSDGVSRCIPVCETDADCRESEGYVCDEYDTCWIGVGTVPPGGSCGADDQCMGGADAICVQQSGFPGGYCVIAGCTDTSCPDGSACRQVFTSGESGCIGLCGPADECRDGFQCVDDSESEWNGACYPGCTTDDDCPGDYGCREEACVDVSNECSAENPHGDCTPGNVCNQGVCEPFACDDTVLEPNETQQAAADLPSADTDGLQICDDDHDWFTFTPDQADTLYMVGIDSNEASGNLHVDMMDESGTIRSDASIDANSYHDENPVGPTNLELHAMVGAADAAPQWLHVFGVNGEVNNYGLKIMTAGYQDGASCTDLYPPTDCAAANSQGGHDPSKLLMFPITHDADPYVGDGFLHDSGLAVFGNPPFTETSRLWGRRELIMAIRYAMHEVQAAFPGTAPLGIGDIGMPDGTTPWGHPNGTHYYGANIDVSYFIRSEFLATDGQLAYRQICCDAPLNDWDCVDQSTSSNDYGTCVAGSEQTHIVDVERTALFIAKLCGTGRVRVIGMEAKIEADIDAALNDLQTQGLITVAERTAALSRMATANDHSSWVWHFNHMHISFEADMPASTTSQTMTLSSGFQGPWLDLPPDEQARRALAHGPVRRFFR